MTGEQFKKFFFNKYFKDVRSRKERDFSNLKQDNISMVEYIKRFDEYFQYVPFIAQNETKKGEHFLRGPNPEIIRDVRMSKITCYRKLWTKH